MLLFPKEHITWLQASREGGWGQGAAGIPGLLPTPRGITPELYQERREPISPLEVSLNSRALDTRQLQLQPPHGSSQGVWGVALHHHVSHRGPKLLSAINA